MAPMVRQDTTDILDQCLDMELNLNDFSLQFDNTNGLPIGEDLLLFDNTKLVEDNGLGLDQQPAVVVQPANPQPQVVAEDYFINFDTQPGSPEFLVMQPAAPEPSMLQALTPVPVPQLALSPAPLPNEVLSPESCDIEVQPSSPQLLDLVGLPASFEIVAASPEDSLAMSPPFVWKEEPVSPASQQGADAPKKRGRKRKYPEGMAPSRRRSTKPKVYEMGPLPDEESEKKRRNAINAKRHRDMQKEEKQKLSDALTEAKEERDRLQQMVNQYKQREQQLLQALNGRGIKVDALHPSLEGF